MKLDLTFEILKKTIVTNKDGNYFWSNGSSRGMCDILETENSFHLNFSVEYGKIELKKFSLESSIIEEIERSIILEKNDSLKLNLAK